MASRIQLGAIGFVVALCACYSIPSILAVKVKQADDGLRDTDLPQTAAWQSDAGKEASRKASNANQGAGNALEAVEIDALASEHLNHAAQSFNEVPAMQIDAEAAKIDAVPSQHLHPATQSFNEIEALPAKLKESKEKRVAAEGNALEAVEIDAFASEHLKPAATHIDAKAAKIDAVPSEHLHPVTQSFNEIEALQAKLKEAKEKRVAAEEHRMALQIEAKELWEKHAAHSALHGSKVTMMEKVANSADKVTEKATVDIESDHQDDQQGRHIDDMLKKMKDNEGLQEVAQAPRLVELEQFQQEDTDLDLLEPEDMNPMDSRSLIRNGKRTSSDEPDFCPGNCWPSKCGYNCVPGGGPKSCYFACKR